MLHWLAKGPTAPATKRKKKNVSTSSSEADSEPDCDACGVKFEEKPTKKMRTGA